MGADRKWAVLAWGCALALLSSAHAHARTFYVLQLGADAWTLIDPQAIERVPGTAFFRRAWTVTVQRNINSPGFPPQPGYMRTQSDYDCGSLRTRWLKLSAYSRIGTELVSRDNAEPAWRSAADDPGVEASLRVVCQGGAGASVVSADGIGQVVIALMQAWDAPPPSLPAPGGAGRSPRPR